MFHDWVSREVFGLKLSVSVAAQYNRVVDIRLTNCGMFLERAGEHVKGDWSDGGPVVLKLGGSLLDLWDLGERLLEFSCGRRVLVIPGGGAAADVVRRLDLYGGLTAEQSHWMAIESMSFNAELLLRTLRGVQVADGVEGDVSRWVVGTPVVLRIGSWLRGSGRAVAERIPATWDATSDSIAAIVAGAIGVESLILGKSCEPGGVESADLAGVGQVDACFPEFSRGLRLGWCNFRSAALHIRWLQSANAAE